MNRCTLGCSHCCGVRAVTFHLYSCSSHLIYPGILLTLVSIEDRTSKRECLLTMNTVTVHSLTLHLYV